jgi:RND family efflux transporter MFP subunit
VTAAPITQRLVARTVNAVGSLHAFEEVVVSSKVEGRVQRIVADVSTRVKPGEVLLELDATDPRLAVQQAERSLQAELAKWGFPSVPDENVDLSQLPSVRSAKARFDLSKARFERMQSLKSTGSVSDDDFDQAKTDLGILENEWRKEQLLAQSSAAVARLRAADLAIAQQRLADCQVRAPVPSLNDPEHEPEYIVSERLVSEGSLLRPGTEVFRMVFGRTLKLRLSVPEIHTASVRVGQRVDVYPSSIEQPLAGTVAKVAPSVDRATRTFMVEVYVVNTSGMLKPGGFAKASIRIAESEQAVTVPMTSLYSLAGVQKIFVVQDDTAREVQVVLGEQSKEWVEIAQPPIPVGAMVITSGQRLLSDGVRIQIRATESDGDPVPSSSHEANDPS